MKDWVFPASFCYRRYAVRVFTHPMADVMVLWYLMKPWEVVSQHLLEALRQGTQRCKAPSPKLECSCQHVNLLNTSAKIATNIVVGMVWMYFGCGHFYFSSFHSIYGRQTLRKHVHVCKSTKLLRQGCFTKTPNESATGLHLHGDKAWKCSVCIPTTQRRKRQIAVLAWKTWGGNYIVAKANLLCPFFSCQWILPPCRAQV